MFIVEMILSVFCLTLIVVSINPLRKAFMIRTLSDAKRTADRDLPRISVVVIARNEERDIDSALCRLCALDYPDFEIIAVNDRSEDKTGEIMRRYAARDSRVKLVDVTYLPEGWMGKAHAYQKGLERTNGDWILFTEGNIYLEPSSLINGVSLALENNVDMLTLFPESRSRSLWVRTVTLTLGAHILATIQPNKLLDPASEHYFGLSVYNLVRRSILDRTPGFPGLRLEPADDTGLGRLIKQAGGRIMLVWAQTLVREAWYEDLHELIRGFEWNSFCMLGYSYTRIFGVGVLMILLGSIPLACMVMPLGGFARVAGAGAYITGMLGALIARRKFDAGLAACFFIPIGHLIVGWGFIRGGLLGFWRGGLMWRNTIYPLSELREWQRVQL